MAAPDASLAPFATRKRAELGHKLGGIRAEWACWLEETGEGKPLRKHQTQLKRLLDQLGGLADAVAERIDALGDATDVLSEARELQLRVLEVHRLWDYYRVKLNLRHVAWFREYLAAADDLVWECYRPVTAKAPTQRAAPLVFLTGDLSPYTHARSSKYPLEPMRDALNSEQFLAVAAALPVPVIGVPWYQVSHLPDTPLIGHEVGHDLEVELGLTAAIQQHVAPVLHALPDPDRAFAWGVWLEEVHADLVGLMCTGPAFAAAMVDLLVADPVQVAEEARMAATWERHPPASVRIRVLAAALELQGLATESAAVNDAWDAAFGTHDRGFADDAPAVVEALWTGEHEPLGGTLASVLNFSARQQRDAQRVRDIVLAGHAPTAVTDIRALLAGARLAYDDAPAAFDEPRGPDQGRPPQLVLDQLTAHRSDASRDEEVERSPGAAADRAAGRALLDRITQAIKEERTT